MIAALLAVAALAAPQGFSEAKPLESAASFVAGKPVQVYCAGTADAWQAYLVDTYGSVSDASGSAPFGGSEAYLAPSACTNLLRLHSPPFYAGLAPSVLTLTHEAIHLRGERDEGATDCAAVHEMPRVAVRFFRVKAGKSLRALMAAAWAFRSSEAARYRTIC